MGSAIFRIFDYQRRLVGAPKKVTFFQTLICPVLLVIFAYLIDF